MVPIDNSGPIGVFDSGIGGVTTLNEMMSALPRENFLYLADFTHAPYGNKPTAEIAARALACARVLLAEGAKAVTVACNTATAAGISFLRETLGVPVIGAEPALKPACRRKGVRSVLVMLTPAAAAQDKFRRLTDSFPDRKICLLTDGTLATAVEDALCRPQALEALTRRVLRSAPVCDAVVLGCTHYVYLRPYVEAYYGGRVPVFDGNAGIAARVKTLLTQRNLLNDGGCGCVRFLTL